VFAQKRCIWSPDTQQEHGPNEHQALLSLGIRSVRRINHPRQKEGKWNSSAASCLSDRYLKDPGFPGQKDGSRYAGYEKELRKTKSRDLREQVKKWREIPIP
jgi:hypothetical protein